MRWMLNTSEIPSPYTPEVYRVYHDQLQLPVDLLNMHDGTDLLENFLCQVLRGATHTCQAYLSNRSDYQYHSNPSENPFYDMIAYDAFHQGLIRDLRGWRKGADRLYITEMIGRRQQRFRKTPMDLPLICPSRTDVLPLLTKTLDYERAFLPQFFDTDAGSPSLEREFWTQIAKRKFCSVNTTAVLEKPEYRYWLYNIWDPRRGKKPVDWTTSNYTISNANFSKKEGIIIRK